jgi:hypothetical protein
MLQRSALNCTCERTMTAGWKVFAASESACSRTDPGLAVFRLMPSELRLPVVGTTLNSGLL